MKNINTNQELAQLRWACRRGMLELDLLLGQFLDNSFLSLALAERCLFKRLLDCTDQDLFNWLLGGKTPVPVEWLPLIKKIQAYAPTATSCTTL